MKGTRIPWPKLSPGPPHGWDLRRGGISRGYDVQYILREQNEGEEKCEKELGKCRKQQKVFWGGRLLPHSNRIAPLQDLHVQRLSESKER